MNLERAAPKKSVLLATREIKWKVVCGVMYDLGGFGNMFRRWKGKRSSDGSDQWNAGESPGTLVPPVFSLSRVT